MPRIPCVSADFVGPPAVRLVFCPLLLFSHPYLGLTKERHPMFDFSTWLRKTFTNSYVGFSFSSWLQRTFRRNRNTGAGTIFSRPGALRYRPLLEELETRLAPAATISSIVIDSGISAADFITKNTTITLNGAATASTFLSGPTFGPGGTGVDVTQNAALVASIAAPGGSWSLGVPISGTFTDGL